jgi:hypothetical protein
MKKSPKMNFKSVIKRLREFNRWRRGEDERDYLEFGQTPTQIGKDIDFICDYVENKNS